MIFIGQNNELLFFNILNQSTQIVFDKEINSPLTIFWTKDENTIISYEGKELTLKKNTIICLTEFYKIDIKLGNELRNIKFNREFYCILDHDREVSCKGILFFGAKELPIFEIPDSEIEKFEVLWKMFEIEMQSKDELQLEMLQSMLKRFIILCTRIYKSQKNHRFLRRVRKIAQGSGWRYNSMVIFGIMGVISYASIFVSCITCCKTPIVFSVTFPFHRIFFCIIVLN